MKSEKAVFLAPLILVLSLAAGCSRQPNVLTSDQRPASPERPPFESVSATGGVSPTASLATPTSSIPPGTLLTVRIQTAVSSATSHPGDSFEAVVDEPIVAQGQTLVPRGTKIMGRVVAAKASGGSQDPGYLRLVLTAISIDDKSLSLQTSSIFVKGNSRDQRGSVLVAAATPYASGKYASGKKDAKFPAGWRLTFRLTQTLPLPD